MLHKVENYEMTPADIIATKPEGGYRLVTRSDMDGLVCAVLFKELGLVGDIDFVHPKDMQDGLIELTEKDISTNLPYVPGVFVAFDHHDSETKRIGDNLTNHIIDPKAPSAARVVYDYFGGAQRFPKISDDMMAAVDKADAAQFTKEDVLNPQGWELLSFLMDSRTGLGRFREFRISNYHLMMELIDYCQNETNIDKILELPDVAERVELFFSHKDKFEDQIKRCTTVHGPLAVLDLRNEETIFAGNRFMIYALYPETNISCHVLWGKGQQNTVFAFGKSIFDRTNKTHIGELMLKYGGGGHQAAGTCQIDTDVAEETLEKLIAQVIEDAG
ncbi:MAG: exopolyphosphatase [Rhizobiaceae bacterium]|nr:exopolyphosphatase [Rhizobiaceae bacterium]